MAKIAQKDMKIEFSSRIKGLKKAWQKK
jgi:hypothetical protein